MPVGVEKCITTARELTENSEACVVDLYLKSAIEGVVIKWVTQVNGIYANIVVQSVVYLNLSF